MSFDFSMMIDTGGEYPAHVKEIGNVTYNLSPMFTKALGQNINNLQGKLGLELIPILKKALQHIRAQENRKEYEELNPKNGWGNHELAIEALQRILSACMENPKTFLHIS